MILVKLGCMLLAEHFEGASKCPVSLMMDKILNDVAFHDWAWSSENNGHDDRCYAIRGSRTIQGHVHVHAGACADGRSPFQR